MGDWRTQIDWNVTTILVTGTANHFGLCGLPGSPPDKGCETHDAELYCHAHAHGVRVVPEFAPSWDPATAEYGRFLNFSDPAARAAWVAEATATLTAAAHLDGVIYDIEVTPPSYAVPPAQRAGIAALFGETKAAFHAAAPSSLVLSWESVNSSSSSANGLDVEAHAANTDAVAVMAYDMYGTACGDYLHAPYPHCDKAGADAPLSFVRQLLRGWLAIPSVAAERLILVLPAVGFWFDCADGSLQGGHVPPHCRMTSDNRISYHRATALLAATKTNGSLVGPPTLDEETATLFFNWRRGAQIQQVWIDTAETIGAKVAWAKSVGLVGVGLYQGTGAYPDNTTAGSTSPLYDAIQRRFVAPGFGAPSPLKTDDSVLTQPETGGSAASNNSSLSVLDFGVVGDGVHDDSTAIQRCIDALPNDGGIVRFPKGVYALGSTLRLTSRQVRLVGDSYFSVLLIPLVELPLGTVSVRASGKIVILSRFACCPSR